MLIRREMVTWPWNVLMMLGLKRLDFLSCLFSRWQLRAIEMIGIARKIRLKVIQNWVNYQYSLSNLKSKALFLIFLIASKSYPLIFI